MIGVINRGLTCFSWHSFSCYLRIITSKYKFLEYNFGSPLSLFNFYFALINLLNCFTPWPTWWCVGFAPFDLDLLINYVHIILILIFPVTLISLLCYIAFSCFNFSVDWAVISPSITLCHQTIFIGAVITMMTLRKGRRQCPLNFYLPLWTISYTTEYRLQLNLIVVLFCNLLSCFRAYISF